MGSDFSNYQVFLGAEFHTARSELVETIDSAMRSDGMVPVEVSTATIEELLETDDRSRCFAVSPAHPWVTVLDSLPSVYGEPGFCKKLACIKAGQIPEISERDLGGEYSRQEKCRSFLTTLSKKFPTVWVRIFDSAVINAILFLDRQKVGSFKYPWDYRAQNQVALILDASAEWPREAILPSAEIEFWEGTENVACGRKFAALAGHVGWLPESVELGFTVDSEGTTFWYAVPEEYELLCYTEVRL